MKILSLCVEVDANFLTTNTYYFYLRLRFRVPFTFTSSSLLRSTGFDDNTLVLMSHKRTRGSDDDEKTNEDESATASSSSSSSSGTEVTEEEFLGFEPTSNNGESAEARAEKLQIMLEAGQKLYKKKRRSEDEVLVPLPPVSLAHGHQMEPGMTAPIWSQEYGKNSILRDLTLLTHSLTRTQSLALNSLHSIPALNLSH